jgi:hypothetical protein
MRLGFGEVLKRAFHLYMLTSDGLLPVGPFLLGIWMALPGHLSTMVPPAARDS